MRSVELEATAQLSHLGSYAGSTLLSLIVTFCRSNRSGYDTRAIYTSPNHPSSLNASTTSPDLTANTLSMGEEGQ